MPLKVPSLLGYKIVGSLLIAFAVAWVGFFTWAILLSKIAAKRAAASHWFLAWVQEDRLQTHTTRRDDPLANSILKLNGMALRSCVMMSRYYCILLPYCIPVTLLFLYLNWLGMKLYQFS